MLDHRSVRQSIWLLTALLSLSCAEGTPLSGTDAGRSPDLGVSRDSGAAPRDAGPPADVSICSECTVDAQCGDGARCVEFGENKICLELCPNEEFQNCPRTFECAVLEDVSNDFFCIPTEGCCVDQDDDDFGVGVACDGPDCDDDNAFINPDAEERCNGEDDDCNSVVDNNPVDCLPQRCEANGGTYEESGSQACLLNGCEAVAPATCGLFTCVDGGSAGDVCAQSCVDGSGADDDSRCVPQAHCDSGACVPDLDDGRSCTNDNECTSGYCGNGFCCAGEDCCATDSDCPGFPGEGNVCNDRVSCQGSRGVVQCSASSQCETTSGVADDTGCGGSPEPAADSCGLFRDVFCTGAADQTAPSCETTCSQDTQCDAGAFCNAFGECELPGPDGTTCGANDECQSGNCDNGFCCGSGVCCQSGSDCPDQFRGDPVCDVPGACQGSVDVATCDNFTCGTLEDQPDDRGCTAGTLVSECSFYPSQFCIGGVEQSVPSCADSCDGDSDCDENAHCDPLGGSNVCLPDVGAGDACDEPSDCSVGLQCNNGFCCAGGECCSTASDCPFATYGVAPFCQIPGQCSGQRFDPQCTAANICSLNPVPVADDSGCDGTLANNCGAFPDIVCSDDITQPTPMCPTSCSTSGDCDPNAFCNGSGTCQSTGGVGAPCDNTAQCDAGMGLGCVDGVCCTSACNGGCEACNVAGSLGTCTAVPNGQDPDAECGEVSCAGYYAGFVGDTCFGRADAPASASTCNGARACTDAADLCPSQGVGASAVTCDSLCQDTVNGTCQGMLMGTCQNVTPSPATTSCGVGACQRTVNRCQSGSQQSCTPGSSSGESCNGVDDDCDGTTDNNISGAVDALEPGNDNSNGREHLGDFGRDGGSVTRSRYMYRSSSLTGDTDWYSMTQRGGGCNGSISYQARGSVTVTVPPGAGTFQVCIGTDTNMSAGECFNVNAGASGSREIVLRCNGCGTGGSDWRSTGYVRVRGLNGAWSCSPYTIQVAGRRTGLFAC